MTRGRSRDYTVSAVMYLSIQYSVSSLHRCTTIKSIACEKIQLSVET